MTAIDPNEVSTGELVIIEDGHRNVVCGPMVLTRRNEMAVTAFGLQIPFALPKQNGIGHLMKPGMTIIEHKAPMLPGTEPYMRGRAAIQRNARFRTNPT